MKIMKNLKQIKSDFIKVLAYSQNLPASAIKVDEIFEKWYEQKKAFIKAFSTPEEERYIYKYGPVSATISEKRKDELISNFLVDLDSFLPVSIVDEIEVFIKAQGRDGFFDNKVVTSYKYKGKLITKERKISKSLKYFIADEEKLDRAQTIMSQYVQEAKVTGILCLSCHPLDYLALSESPYNWRSCHALDGEYRAGNINYMLDNSTIICYLESENGPTVLPRFPADVPWSAKKWRRLVFLSQNHDMVFAGRQYPMQLSTGLDWISFMLDKTLYKDISCNSWMASWSDWRKDRITEYKYDNGEEIVLRQPYFPIINRIIPQNNLIIDGKNTYHFNDLKFSSDYVPFYKFRRYTDTASPELKFHIGEAFPCIICGHVHNYASDNFLCEECDDKFGTTENEHFGFCPRCGRRIHRSSFVYIQTLNTYWCEECAHDEGLVKCEDCGAFVHSSDIHNINGMLRCNRCFEYLTENGRSYEYLTE